MAYKVIAVIQARMGSSRLPGKTLTEIVGKPLLEHVVNRLRYSKTIDKIIVATTSEPVDKAIVNLVEKIQVASFVGSSEDVLDRFYQCAKLFGGSVLVRITADDPFKDPKVIDEIVNYFFSNPELDYASNTIQPSYPIGLDVEVFSFTALKKAWEEANSVIEREHVTPYIWGNSGSFKIANIKNNTDLSHLRWTIDTKKDLEMTKEVYKKLYVEDEIFYMDDILSMLKKYTYISDLNSDVEQLTISSKGGEI
jgi:spore coat polysaccharide biosynthesis protein SpsF